MGVFKSNSPEKVVDDTRVVVHDFQRRAPFWSYRTVPYKEYEPLVNLQGKLDDYLDALFCGDIDSANGDVLDNIIFDTVRQAQDDLNRQRVEHGDTIKSFGIRAEGDRAAFKEQLAKLREDLARNQEEQAFIRDMLHRCEYREV